MELIKNLRKLPLIKLAVCLLCLFSLINGQTQNEYPISNLSPIQYNLLQVVQGAEGFSLELFRRIAEALPHYNLMMSPFTIWAILLLTAEGARGNTFNELRQVLRTPEDIRIVREAFPLIMNKLTSQNDSLIDIMSSQIVIYDKNQPLNPSYIDRVESLYSVDLQDIDYKNLTNAQTLINNAVSRATRGKITDAIKAEDLLDAQLVLISALYFQGQWQFPFNSTFTKEEYFFDEEGKPIGTVNMMFQRGSFAYLALAEVDSHILELPYGNDNRFSMIILLPKKGAQIEDVIKKLENIKLGRIMDELKRAAAEFEDDEVEVHLPKFKIQSHLVLNVVLEQMGLSDIFNAQRADLLNLSNKPSFLSRVIHKAEIEVNEEGTTAAAITGAIFSNKATPPRFYANHPFIYMIVEKSSNILLYCGQAKKPNKFKI